MAKVNLKAVAKKAAAAENETKKAAKIAEAGQAAAHAECGHLEAVVQRLDSSLASAQQIASDLQDDLDKVKMPQYVDLDREFKSDRTKRRAVHSDRLYLSNILSSREWRPADLASALEQNDLLEKLLDTRQVTAAR